MDLSVQLHTNNTQYSRWWKPYVYLWLKSPYRLRVSDYRSCFSIGWFKVKLVVEWNIGDMTDTLKMREKLEFQIQSTQRFGEELQALFNSKV